MNRAVALSLWLALAGVVLTVPVLVREHPLTFVIFSFVAQPLLMAAFLVYAWTVVSELRRSGLFR